jgi:hypothetical protein
VNNSTNRGRQIVDERAARGIITKTSPAAASPKKAPAHKDTEAVVASAEAAGLARSAATLRPVICQDSGGPLSCFYKKNAGSQALSAPDAEHGPGGLLRLRKATDGFTSISISAASAASYREDAFVC